MPRKPLIAFGGRCCRLRPNEPVRRDSWTYPYGVRAKPGDFEPVISEDLFYRVQAVLSGRVPSTTPQQRAHPDFLLRAFVSHPFLWSRPHRQLVEGPKRVLRVIPLPPWLPRGQRDEGQTRRTVRRRTRPAAANARLHAATQGIRSADLEGAESGRARGTRDRRACCKGDAGL